MNNVKPLTQEIHQNFIDYSHEVNVRRAFADARDGLKPGQRACLWEMFIKGYSSSKPHVKSAKIDGGVIGSWWPHGQLAIYETFTRMSQPWVNNIPEVDWHGSNGSIQISGEAAADRYTEARLSKAAEEGMLVGIKKNNVPMRLNFSEDAYWAEVLPAIFPRLLVNGCQGIGSTIANHWTLYNLRELFEVIKKYVESGILEFNNLYPDFPTGGIIINKKDLPTIHATGKGKVVLRGRANIEGNHIMITEIPYQVYVEPLIEQIKELVIKDEIEGITDVMNKSDKKRLLIDIECSGNPQSILKQLYKYTNLQKTFSPNQVALDGKVPRLMNLKEYLDIYIQHNKDCIYREKTDDLVKAKERYEIVIGLVKALENIDNIIKVIKGSPSSSEAVNNLIKEYEFTEPQAKAIVNMRLGKLANLEKVELNQEKEDLENTISECEEYLKFEEKRSELFIQRLTAFVDKYGYNRRTEVINLEVTKEEKEIADVIPEDVVITVSKTGMVKRVPKSSFKVQKRGGVGVKSANEAILETISTNTIDHLMFFSSKGKMFRIVADEVPAGTNVSKGFPLSSILKLESDENIIAATALSRGSEAKYVIFFTKNGIVKKTSIEEYMKLKKNSNGLIAIKLGGDDSIANVVFANDEKAIVVTKKGLSIKIDTATINPIGRATTGVKGIKLEDGDEVIYGGIITKEDKYLATFSNTGCAKKTALDEFVCQGRGGKGIYCFKSSSNDELASAELIGDNDNVLISTLSNVICISSNDIPLLGRTAMGNIVAKGKIVSTLVL